MTAETKLDAAERMTSRDKLIRMDTLHEAALAVCRLCQMEKQLNHFANDEAYHPWDGYVMTCAASRIWVLYQETARKATRDDQ